MFFIFCSERDYDVRQPRVVRRRRERDNICVRVWMCGVRVCVCASACHVWRVTRDASRVSRAELSTGVERVEQRTSFLSSVEAFRYYREPTYTMWYNMIFLCSDRLYFFVLYISL